MASNQHDSRNPRSPQSIPLQDLSSRSPDGRNGKEEWQGLGRQVSKRAGALLGNRQSFHGLVSTAGRYERVGDGPPPDTDRSSLDVPHVTTPGNTHPGMTFYDDGELSPVNVGAFQAASVGLSFDNPGPSRPMIDTAPSSGRRKSHLGMITEQEAMSSFESATQPGTNASEGYFSPQDEDRAPLTDERYLQPISGSHPTTPSAQRPDKRSPRGSRTSPGSRLGDDLANVEAGLQVPGSRSVHRASSYSTRSLSRSLSVSASPLSSAGSILRKMSQRVVNLSNEPDPIEQPLRRQASSKQARLEEPPSFPAMTEYAHDEPIKTPPAIEKVSPLVSIGKSREIWQQQPNPLKGRSLGIFAPNNRLRLWLCELLVHPVTEPVILILIVAQTILLAIDAANPVGYNTRAMEWKPSFINVALLVLFSIYTLEITARVIVSGLIKNADEYSTLNRALGFKQAIFKKLHEFFSPEHQQTQASTAKIIDPTDPQVSILRSFTTIQAQPDQPGHSRQQQRVRLARRAFLRHSFNRLDFLAVVSFWTSFILSIFGLAPNRLVYVFQMLSCLRILRLLGLTSGTSVCSEVTRFQ